MKKGFTLIELLVVITIIGVVSSIILTNVSKARAKARDTRRISDIHQLKIALELYYSANNAYPPENGNGRLDALNVLVSNGYIPELPNDPLNAGSTPDWSWTNQNTYYYWGTGNVGTCGPYNYTLWYRMETKTNGNAPSCVGLDSNSFISNP